MHEGNLAVTRGKWRMLQVTATCPKAYTGQRVLNRLLTSCAQFGQTVPRRIQHCAALLSLLNPGLLYIPCHTALLLDKFNLPALLRDNGGCHMSPVSGRSWQHKFFFFKSMPIHMYFFTYAKKTSWFGKNQKRPRQSWIA